MTRLAFDIYDPPTDPSLGTRRARLTGAELGPGSFYRHTLGGIGTVRIVLERGQSVLDASVLRIGAYVVVRDLDLSATDTLNVVGGGSLLTGDFAVVEDPGRGVLEFGGPSTKALLADAIMGPESLSPFEGPYSIVDGYWRWGSDVYGGVLRRAILEANLQDPPGLPMIDIGVSGGVIVGDGLNWDDSGDSNGDPWPSFAGDFRTQAGTDLLALATELYGYGVETDIDARTFDMYAYNAGGFGSDLTGGAFGAGVVRFVAGVNIGRRLERHIQGRLPLTHVLVRTVDHPEGAWIESDTYSPGDPVRKAPYQTGDISGDPAASTALQERAQRLMDIRQLAEDGIEFHTIKPGDDEANGRYTPGPHYSPGATATAGHFWVGDYVTIHSGTSDVDYNNAAKRIESITYEMGEAADDDDGGWNVIVGIGPRVGAVTQGGFGGPLPISFGSPGTDCEALTAADLTAGTATNGNVEAGASTQWSGGSVSTTMKHAGTNGYSRSGDGSLVYTFAPSQVFTGGVRYVVDIWARFANDHLSSSVTIGSGGDSDTSTYTGTAGTDPPGTFLDTETGADGEQWAKLRVCWTPSIDRTGVVVTVTADVSSGSWAVDDLELFTAPASGEISGSSSEPARADHSHNHNDLLGRNAPDAHTAAAIAFVPNGSIAATNVQAAIQEVRDEAGGSSYTDENAQDAVGGILVDSATVDMTYNDATPSIAASVIPGGIKLDDLGTPDDNTDLDASTSRHGLLRKLPGGTTDFLRADGTFAAPGGGYTDEQAQDAVGGILTDTDTVDFTYSDATPSITAIARLPVRKNSGGSELIRRRLNLIEGTGVTLTLGDDAGNDEVDVTIDLAAESGASGVVPWAIYPMYGFSPESMRSIGAANRIIYVPVVIPTGLTLTGIRCRVGTSSGNIAMALYNSAGNRVATSGIVACPATGFATVAFTSNYVATAGRYWLAWWASNGTQSIQCSDDNSVAHPLVCKFEDPGAGGPPSAMTIAGDTVRAPNIFGVVNGVGYP